mmetsp:Transcript_22792/g.41031  ORF Transcript_22792/g.41031 Transcript_22792/m.41031 type:complete len:228 (+) Transcript_22792:2-685(+)
MLRATPRASSDLFLLFARGLRGRCRHRQYILLHRFGRGRLGGVEGQRHVHPDIQVHGVVIPDDLLGFLVLRRLILARLALGGRLCGCFLPLRLGRLGFLLLPPLPFLLLLLPAELLLIHHRLCGLLLLLRLLDGLLSEVVDVDELVRLHLVHGLHCHVLDLGREQHIGEGHIHVADALPDAFLSWGWLLLLREGGVRDEGQCLEDLPHLELGRAEQGISQDHLWSEG